MTESDHDYLEKEIMPCVSSTLGMSVNWEREYKNPTEEKVGQIMIVRPAQEFAVDKKTAEHWASLPQHRAHDKVLDWLNAKNFK